jgi:hypothetical protein
VVIRCITRENVVGSEEVMAMVILSYALCLSLGASIGFLCAGLYAAASDKTEHPIKR